MNFYEETMNANPLLKYLVSEEVVGFVVGFAILHAIFIRLGVIRQAFAIVLYILKYVKKIILNTYIHLMLILYCKKSNIDASEYRGNFDCNYMYVVCRHITNADTLIINHMNILIPLIKVLRFINKVYDKYNEKSGREKNYYY